ncbi:Peptidoglycan/xylan/chitin deacetylase, PgdA/CDA1 family [Lentzea xinjiangensis]|uniref:Peptidoglycan/xylan/chitin deacetylase, PgdA/CDA1 family n=1 Tax=Lentzea xinjiangensis TaxID=402600 RepID=A0A1H9WC59_9PSEU|nr:polysaccharide deacetylase family protein [Lentzea xinjiangensis]SES31536.1 Peptidoglycan/xylan/chitin deacetylase, PgdA/CDA1 family [Lentzea xinjiangensis]
MFKLRLCAAFLLVAGAVACGQPAGEPAGPVLTTSAPPAATTPAERPQRMFEPPYPYGTVQAKAPAVVDGMVPVVTHIPVDKPYVFITVDDGAVQHPKARELMIQAGVWPTVFLNTKYAEGHKDYFKALPVTVHSHTTSHPNLLGRPYEFQRNEICGNADFLTAEYGRRPTLFRPPFGNFDATTRQAAAGCGFKALVNWTAAVNDGRVQFQAGDRLKAGDIVLMHFRTTFAEDFTAFLNRAKQDGLTPVPLEDFLG